MKMTLKQAAELVQIERETDGAVAPSKLFVAIRKTQSAARADRIIALMGNGVSLHSAMKATWEL